MRWLLVATTAIAGGLLLAWAIRVREERTLDLLWHELDRAGESEPFDPASIAELPAPAQRYFRHAIAPGTSLAGSVRLSMHGTIRLQPDADPLPMQAEQLLAPPHGLVWKARVGQGLLRIRGFDRYGHARGAMRWWLYGLVPVVRADGPDVSRSAAGRVGGEAVFLPSALLPQPGVTWEAVDDHTARVMLRVDDEPVTFALTVDAQGRLQKVSVRRWKEDRGDGRPGYVWFDVDAFEDERTVHGYTVPTRFRAGWRLGDAGADPFFHAVIDSLRYR